MFAHRRPDRRGSRRWTQRSLWIRPVGVFRAAIAAAFTVCLVATGCASSSSSSSPSGSGGAPTSPAPATSEICRDLQGLKASLTDLRSVDLRSGDAAGTLQAAIGEIKTQASALGSSVSQELQPKVDALTTAVTDLGDTIKSLPSPGTSAMPGSLSQVRQQIGAIAEAVGELTGSLKQTCESS